MMEAERIDQIKAIKNRLNRLVFPDGETNISRICELIKQTEGLYSVPLNTLYRLFSEQETAADLCALVAVCRCLDLDIAYILSPPEPNAEKGASGTAAKKFPVLRDPRYLGMFHGFFYTPNPERDELIRFDLELKKTTYTTTATMTYYGKPVDVYQQVMPDVRILQGTPYLDEFHSNIHIELTNEAGDYYFLYFTRQRLRSHDLYFRRGIAITPSSVSTNAPLLQNFVLFAREVSDDKLTFVHGLLADVSPEFYIEKAKLRQLCEEYPVVQRFYQSFEHILEHDVVSVYPINEEAILAANQSGLDRSDIVAALLLLKGGSIATRRQVFEDLDAYGTFSKNVLQQPCGYAGGKP